MPMYEVDDNLAFLVDRLAPRSRPFETLSFQEGLRRVLSQFVLKTPPLDLQALAGQATESTGAPGTSIPKKAPTPSAMQYAASVPELKRQRHLTSWKAICDTLDIETFGDSARRKLAAWVRFNRPDWPRVPDTE